MILGARRFALRLRGDPMIAAEMRPRGGGRAKEASFDLEPTQVV